MNLFRYPGGKTKLKTEILKKLNTFDNVTNYCEPFFGGGSIGIEFAKFSNINDFIINDKDIGLYCLWNAIIINSYILKEKVNAFIPSVQSFYDFKEELLTIDKIPDTNEKIVDIGFKKIAIHQISYSGLGTKSGGPLGGKDQLSKYNIGCRWSSKLICSKIDNIQSIFNTKNINVYNNDFSDIINNCNESSLIYLDPPYFDKGNELYQCGFTLNDHIRLMDILKKTKGKWVLSYDNVKDITELYSWAKIQYLDVNYTISTARKKTELLIYL